MIKTFSRVCKVALNNKTGVQPVVINYIPSANFALFSGRKKSKATTENKTSNATAEQVLNAPEDVSAINTLADLFSNKNTELQQKLSAFDFQKDILPQVNKFFELGFTKNMLERIAQKEPESLVNESEGQQGRNTLANLTEYLKGTHGFTNAEVRDIVLKTPHFLGMSQDELLNRVNLFEQKFELTKEEIRAAIEQYPLLFRTAHDTFVKKAELIRTYLPVDDKTIGRIQANAIFFLATPTEYFKRNLEYLLRRGFTEEQVIQILLKHAEVITMSPGALTAAFDIPRRRLGLSNSRLHKIMAENPRLITVDPTTMMAPKVQALEDAGFTTEEIRKMFETNPRIFIKSVNSFKTKLKYLVQRQKMNLKTDPAFPYILNFHYGRIIRPRGELMLAKNRSVPWIDVLNLTEGEFCNLIGATVPDLNTYKDEKLMTVELDAKRRFFTNHISNIPKEIDY